MKTTIKIAVTIWVAVFAVGWAGGHLFHDLDSEGCANLFGFYDQSPVITMVFGPDIMGLANACIDKGFLPLKK